MPTQIQEKKWWAKSLAGSMILGILPLVTLLFFWIFYFPLQAAKKELSDSIEEKAAYIEQTSLLLPQLKQTALLEKKTQRYVANWEKNAPTETEFSKLFGAISEQAKLANIKIDLYEPQKPTIYHTINAGTATLKCTGTYKNICEFLYHIENFPETLWTNSLSITRNGENRETLTLNMVLTVFSKKTNIRVETDR
ncbi:MAG: type 4a pilus biogenesis protein PilO [Pirellulaceae bacterium]|nr:type 4a pilus biogenesis protein PilO [Pirellulaceae bacterium]